MNLLSLSTSNPEALNTVYNVAYGQRATLNELVSALKASLSPFDKHIKNIDVKYGPVRDGDIPHSLASIDKAKKLLGYNPIFSLKKGLEEAIQWYWKNLK